MRCPVCDRNMTGTICGNCGMRASWIQKIRNTSRRFLRQGLYKAKSGDYSGALNDLEKALQYDKTNIEAYNIIGLIYYQRGEIGECVRQWTRSINYSSANNPAAQYLEDLQENSRQYAALCSSIELYNEAVDQARKNDVDFALARLRKAVSVNKNFVKAHLLMALCYIRTGNLKKAEMAVKKVEQIEPMHALVYQYTKVIEELRQEGNEEMSREIRDLSRDFYVQQTMPEPDLKEISTGKVQKKFSLRSGQGAWSQAVLFALGALCCWGILALLYVPDQIGKYKEENLTLRNEVQQLKEKEEQWEEISAEKEEKVDQLEQQIQEQKEALEQQIQDLQTQMQEQEALKGEGELAEAVNCYFGLNYDGCAEALYQASLKKMTDSEQTLFDRLYSDISRWRVGTYMTRANSWYSQMLAEGETPKKDTLENTRKNMEVAAFLAKGDARQVRAVSRLADVYCRLGELEKAERAVNWFFEIYTGNQNDSEYLLVKSVQDILQTAE